MKNKILKKFILIALTFILVIGSSVAVFAASAYSDWETVTIYGNTYDYRNIAYVRYLSTGNTIEAIAEAKTVNNPTVPTGYMGGQARLYHDVNNIRVLKCSSDIVYNNNPAHEFTVYSDRTTDNDYYYALSYVKFYNGNGYVLFNINRTPNACPSSRGEVTDEDNMCRYNEIVESADEEYELIPAEGVDGTIGYVRSDELMPNHKTIEEAIEFSKKSSGGRTIPLYDDEGAVIGEFALSPVTEEGVAALRKELDEIK